MKKLGLLALALLLLAPGCCRDKKNQRKKMKQDRKSDMNKDVKKEVDISVADSKITSYFDDGIEEFSFSDAQKSDSRVAGNIDVESSQIEKDRNDYSWTALRDSQAKSDFDNVYFDFDKYNIKASEQEKALKAAQVAKMKIEEEKNAGKIAQIVIVGNADSSAGSDVYNLALSEKRAKVLADEFIAGGIAADDIKIVGRGSEVPAIIDGKPVKGDRNEQWANRRDEIHLAAA